MRKVTRFDELPNKIKYLTGGGVKDLDKCRNRFAQMEVYECKNKAEVYEIMKRENLEPITLLDKDPMQGRFFFAALGLPDRRAVDDLILFNPVERPETVLYFAPMSTSEAREVLEDERKARTYYKEKLERQKLKKELENGNTTST